MGDWCAEGGRGAAEKTDVCRSKLKVGDDLGPPSPGHDQRGCGKRLPNISQYFSQVSTCQYWFERGLPEREEKAGQTRLSSKWFKFNTLLLEAVIMSCVVMTWFLCGPREMNLKRYLVSFTLRLKQNYWDHGGQRSLECYSPWGLKESDTA